jgi:dihydrofolate synthase/folylpolyglutamate synthase
MAGRHQLENLATAMAAIDALRGMGWDLDEDHIWGGISSAVWPGRLWSPAGLPPNVVLDGAHNGAGAAALAGHLIECGVRPHIFFSAMGDKDMASIAWSLSKAMPSSVTLVQGCGPRYASMESMVVAWGRAGLANPLQVTLRELAIKLQEKTSDTYLVTGSLYFLGDLMKEMGIGL